MTATTPQQEREAVWVQLNRDQSSFPRGQVKLNRNLSRALSRGDHQQTKG